MSSSATEKLALVYGGRYNGYIHKQPLQSWLQGVIIKTEKIPQEIATLQEIVNYTKYGDTDN